MRLKKVNVEPGKQGFQHTVPTPAIPVAAEKETVPPVQPEPEPSWGNLFQAQLEEARARMLARQEELDNPPQSSAGLLDKFTDNDLHNLYSGSDCHELARWFVEEDRERFRLWTVSCEDEEDGDGGFIPARWFVEDKQRGVFIDIYGDSTSPEHLMSEWPDFKGQKLVYRSHDYEEGVALAERTMGGAIPAHRGMKAMIIPAFGDQWKERANEAVNRLGLLKQQ